MPGLFLNCEKNCLFDIKFFLCYKSFARIEKNFQESGEL